jgi:hypothetical protein
MRREPSHPRPGFTWQPEGNRNRTVPLTDPGLGLPP